MTKRSIRSSIFYYLSLLIIILPKITLAQLIPLKTVPIATGNQFLVFPSQNLGMGSVSIAVDDPLLDPFINPAKGTRIRETVMFSSPVYYRISDNVSARTLPLGAFFSSDNMFGGFSVAIQQLEEENANNTQLLRGKYSDNMYASGILGKKLSGSNISIAGSIFWAGLNAVEGVDQLYAGSEKIDQFGQMVDVRIGLLKELERDHSFEALLLINRFNMDHDVTYVDQVWNGGWDTRVEKNLDRSNMFGLHMGYVRPISDSGWRIGGIMTGNWKSYPKIPNYSIMNIPRDPGNASAYNLGFGFSKTHENVTLGVDFVYEPIWSNTWADAAEPVTTNDGGHIPVGGKTIENDFRFSNKLLRMGIHEEGKRFGYQLGIQVRSIRYLLDQYDYIENFQRSQIEQWLEWTTSWSLSLNLKNLPIRYIGLITTGTGRPGVSRLRQPDQTGLISTLGASDFVLAPSGPLSLEDARVITHQISVTIPLRN